MMLIKGIAVIAGILFVFSPLRSGTQVLVFIGSIVVLAIRAVELYETSCEAHTSLASFQ